MIHILLVEDDKELCGFVSAHLQKEGYLVDTCHNGDDGLHYAYQGNYDLAILDRLLPGSDGIQILRHIREQDRHLPVLMLTALGQTGDKVVGLDAGADDYLVKPFDLPELSARIRALLRRPGPIVPEEDVLRYGDLTFHPNKLLLEGKKKSAVLAKKEGELLELLMRADGATMDRANVFHKIWGNDSDVDDRNLDNYIHFLRKRLKAVSERVVITTVRGIGFRLEDLSC